MAALAGDLSKAILGQSDAAKAFRPWWDSVEDLLMYSFVVMSLVTLPMTFLSGNPVDCAIHRHYWQNSTEHVPKYTRYIQGYAKKYCTETHLSIFLLYLPFTLLLAPLLLTAVDKLFIKFFRCENKFDQFYSLLVKESLGTEDVGNLETENVKDMHEIRQAFRNSSGCYYSYLYRTVFELMIVCGLLALFIKHRDISGFLHPFFDCDVHGTYFECVVPNSKFFFIIFCFSVLNLFGYLVCTIYNLVWILIPRMNKLRHLLVGCKRTNQTFDTNYKSTSFYQNRYSLVGEHLVPVLSGRLEMYFDKSSRDFSLLMDQLAESSGLVQPLRILSMFDRQFQKMWAPEQININKLSDFEVVGGGTSDDKTISIEVLWSDCHFADYAVAKLGKIVFEYTVEIQPQTEASIKSLQYYRLDESYDDNFGDEESRAKENGGDISSNVFNNRNIQNVKSQTRLCKYSTRFDGLSSSQVNIFKNSFELAEPTQVFA